MYCPSCGSDADERQPSQYCRACGFDLRGVRQTLERPDSITDSAISARQQISLAIAEKIKEVEPEMISKRSSKKCCLKSRSFLSHRKNVDSAAYARA
jgi:hypothetical protein